MKEESDLNGLKLDIQNIKIKKKNPTMKIMASGPIALWQIDGGVGGSGNSDRFYFPGLQKSLQMVTEATTLKEACSLEEKLWQS